MRHFITHVFNEGLPTSGFRKLTYITITDEDTPVEEFFLGTDNNPIPLIRIDEMVKNGELLPLHGDYPELPEGKSLFVNSKGELYFANRLDSDSGRVRLNNQVKELSDLSNKMMAEKYIPKELPKIHRFHQYV